MSEYCGANHQYARGRGCLGVEGHKGDHYAWHVTPPGYKFHWPNEAEAENPNIFLTPNDVGILLTALDTIKQFFPELEQKLSAVKGLKP